MDFRLGFGSAFGEETRDRRHRRAPSPSASTRAPVAAELYGDMAATLRALVGDGADTRRRGSRELRDVETEKRAAERERARATTARRCTRCGSTASSAQVLDRDAIVIGDGGDFVSYAGRVVDSYEPGCWLDPGPFGCLGTGPGYALAAKLAHPGPPGRAAARRRRVRLHAAWSTTRSPATASTSSA